MPSPNEFSSTSSLHGQRRHSWIARHRGGIALTISLAGFVAAEVQSALGVLPSVASQLCVAAFEGALVGSLADWFAVTALFKKIPLPVLSRHTDLIAQKRDSLSRGIVDMVENEWLSPTALRKHLERFSFAEMILRRVDTAEGQATLSRLSRRQLLKAVEWLDDPRCLHAVDILSNKLVERFDVAQQLAPFLRRLSKDKELQDRLWHGAMAVLERVLRDPQLLTILSDILLDQMESLSNEGRWKSVKVWVGKQFLDGEDDRDKVERLLTRLLNSAQEQLEEIEHDQAHPLRLRMRALLVITARHLEHNKDSRLASLLERSKWQLFNAYQEQQGSRSWIHFAQRWLTEQLSDSSSTLSQLVGRGVNQLIQQQLGNPGVRKKLDQRIRQWAGQLLNEYPHAVGDVVRESLSEASMPTEKLVSQIEERVGPDLQWIRVNGAVVGGTVALMITALRLSILAFFS
ncbi:hypothetical protein LMG33818_000184 [Halomonadaceae bacterium LMG 33818]|uniref:DUF445 domain-containing protein n=1 Tax=Cernens ardua TaxID=3402176 RepID=UPI003EDB8587